MCVCVVHWHCTAQLSMFNMEKRFRNKIIIIIIIIKFRVSSMTPTGKAGSNPRASYFQGGHPTIRPLRQLALEEGEADQIQHYVIPFLSNCRARSRTLLFVVSLLKPLTEVCSAEGELRSQLESEFLHIRLLFACFLS